MTGVNVGVYPSILAILGIPSYGDPNAALDIGFTTGQAGKSGQGVSFNDVISVTRNSVKYAEDSNGDYTEFAANVAARTDKGILIEPQVTNKCQNYNLNPTDLTGLSDGVGSPVSNGFVTVVDDSVELANAGIDVGNGKVIRMLVPSATASGEHVIIVTGQPGNTNSHTLSCFARKISGAGAEGAFIEWQGTGFTGDLNAQTSSSTYTRIYQTTSPAASNLQLTIRVSHVTGTDSEVYFTLNQLEEFPIATSPIEVAGATGTREADQVSSDSTEFDFSEASAVIDVDVLTFENTSFSALLSMDDGSADNRAIIERTSSTSDLRSVIRVASATSAQLTHGSFTNDEHKLAIAWDASEFTYYVDASKVGDATPSSPVTDVLDTIRFGMKDDNSKQPALWFRNAAFYTSKLSDAELQSKTT